MSKKLYIGNLDYSVTSDELAGFLAETGEVEECKVIEGKGFGFVTFANEEAATKVKDSLQDNDFKGRPLKIDFARENRERSGGGGGGFRKRY